MYIICKQALLFQLNQSESYVCFAFQMSSDKSISPDTCKTSSVCISLKEILMYVTEFDRASHKRERAIGCSHAERVSFTCSKKGMEVSGLRRCSSVLNLLRMLWYTELSSLDLATLSKRVQFRQRRLRQPVGLESKSADQR